MPVSSLAVLIMTSSKKKRFLGVKLTCVLPFPLMMALHVVHLPSSRVNVLGVTVSPLVTEMLSAVGSPANGAALKVMIAESPANVISGDFAMPGTRGPLPKRAHLFAPNLFTEAHPV